MTTRRQTLMGQGSVSGVLTHADLAGYLTKAGNLAGLADTVAARTNLGVAIGTDVQAYDTDLAAIAALTTTGILERTGAGAYTTHATLPLSKGGTNNNLTASAGGIAWSDSTKLNILSGTATANLPLVSGASVTPAWGAFTLPASVTSGGVPYFSSSSAMSSSGALGSTQVVLGGGAGAAPNTSANWFYDGSFVFLQADTTAIGYYATVAGDTAGNGPQNVFRRARNTLASLADVTNNNALGAFSFRGYVNGAYSGSKAFLSAQTTEAWSSTANGTAMDFRTTPVGSTTLTRAMTVDSTQGVSIGVTYSGTFNAAPANGLRVQGKTAIGVTTPTAVLHLAAGTTAANTAPLKLTSGSLMTSAEAGAIEFLTDSFYATITTGAARKEITLNDAALTSGRLPFATTNGRLTDSANATLDSSGNLTLGGLLTSAGVTSSVLIQTTGGAGIRANVSGSLVNSSEIGSFQGSTNGVGISAPSAANIPLGLWNKGTTGDNVFAKFYTDAGVTERGGITYNRAGGLTSFDTTSDPRAKLYWRPIDDARERLLALRPYMGMMKGAQIEVPMLLATEAPRWAVTGEPWEERMQGINLQIFAPLLIAGYQDLDRRVSVFERGDAALHSVFRPNESASLSAIH